METNRKTALLLVFSGAALFLTLVALAAVGLRGSDQYWYTAEVAQILAGHANEANSVFPYHAIRGLVPPPFNHHTPTHYVVAAMALLTGPYHGWIAVNVLATLAAGVFVFLLVNRLSNIHAAGFALVVWLLLPLGFWITAQPYLESSLAPFVAAGLFLYIGVADSGWKWAGLFLLFAVATWCRVSFLAFLCVVPIGYLLHSRPLNRKKLAVAALMLAAIPVVIKSHSAIFQPDPALTLRRYVNAGVPGVSGNMRVLYALEDEPVEAWKLWRKMIHGVEGQFIPISLPVQLFFAPFNLMALAALVFAWRNKSPYRFRIIAATVLVFGFHFLTISLRASEFRFLHPPNPLMVWGSVLLLASLPLMQSARRWMIATITAMVVLGSIDLGLALFMRDQAAAEQTLRAELASILDQTIKPGEGVVLDTGDFGPDLILAYVLRPSLVLHVNDSYQYTADELATMTRNIGGAWLFARRGSPLLTQLSLAGTHPVRSDFPAPYERYSLYRLADFDAKP